MNNTKSSIASKTIDSFWDSLRNGKQDGLEGIYFLLYRRLFQMGMSVVKDEEFVADCLQEVFIDLWKYHKNLPKVDHVHLYLFRALNHKIFKEIKKSKQRKSIPLHENLKRYACSESVEKQLIDKQQHEILTHQLATALGSLPIRQKEVIHYLFFEEVSYEQVSKIMGINLRSVYTLAWKAITSLRKSVF
ncbi:RNA polymerase sigma factor [Lunatibacter salilacus]|uniref:RNA polymerase sigma factor n=1 Tax=Lunatibacter salilacus TaxID=2483804 RepID=UPI001F2961B5|nr:sigma-70 family RNA polymerase sigma factor [Lunatibacter salilacus]